MVGYPGDMTDEDIKKQLRKDLRQRLVGATTDISVTIPPATAAMLLELLPKDEEEEGEDK